MFRQINNYDKCGGNDCLKDDFLCEHACMMKILLGNKYEVPIELKSFYKPCLLSKHLLIIIHQCNADAGVLYFHNKFLA